MMSRSLFLLACLFLFSSFFPSIVRGQQSLFIDDDGGRAVGIEYKKALLESGDASVASSVWFLSGRFPIGANSAIIGEVSAVIADLPGGFETQASVGNPMIGVHVNVPNSNMYGQATIRIPVNGDGGLNALVFGLISDFERFEAFYTDTIPLSIKFGYRKITASGLYVNARTGLVGLLGDEDASRINRPDFLFDYQAVVGYNTQRLRITTGITGRWAGPIGGIDLTNRIAHQVSLQFSTKINKTRPGLLVSVPIKNDSLNDVSDFVKVIIGLTLSFSID